MHILDKDGSEHRKNVEADKWDFIAACLFVGVILMLLGTWAHGQTVKPVEKQGNTLEVKPGSDSVVILRCGLKDESPVNCVLTPGHSWDEVISEIYRSFREESENYQKMIQEQDASKEELRTTCMAALDADRKNLHAIKLDLQAIQKDMHPTAPKGSNR